ncbi:MAG: amidohydrolase family protein [Haloferacaceae archaeon]
MSTDDDRYQQDPATPVDDVEVVDAFAHVLPEPFLERMRTAHPSEELAAMDDDRFWDVERRLADMDAAGIDRQVLTLARASLWRGLDAAEALALVRAANDAVAAYAEQSDRFLAVGTLPFLTGEYLDELDRCVRDLGMAGVQVFSNVEGRPLDDPGHAPFFERVDRRGVPLWLHPQLHEWHEWDSQHMLHKIFGWPFDTALALGRLACNGVLERHDLDVIAHHAGGMVPHFDERFADMYEGVLDSPEVFPYEAADLPEPPLSYLREIHGDTVLCGSTHATKCAYDFYGEGMVFATDYPFGPAGGRRWPRTTVQAVEGIGLARPARERIYAGTLRELIES